MCDVIIIGAGASGIVCSILSKKNNNKVVVLERNDKTLKKLLMTGNGRCNYMNESYSTKNYHSEDIDIVDKIISSNNIDFSSDTVDNLTTIKIKKHTSYVMPLVGKVLGNEIESTRVIYEQ